MSGLQFFMACVPPTTTHQRKRIVRAGKFLRLGDSPELCHTRAFLEAILMAHRPIEPITGGVSLRLEFVWPWRASEAKRVRALGRVPKLTKPDCSNLAKTLEDRLASLWFIEGDEKVAELHVSKWWGDQPGIGVHIQKVQP